MTFYVKVVRDADAATTRRIGWFRTKEHAETWMETSPLFKRVPTTGDLFIWSLTLDGDWSVSVHNVLEDHIIRPGQFKG